MDNEASGKSFRPELSMPLQLAEGTVPNGAVAGSKYNSVKKKKRTSQGGVLITSLRRQRHLNKDASHFADSTFNSTQRQQPLIPYTPCPPEEVQQHHSPQSHTAWHKTPRFCHVHLTPANFKSIAGKKKPWFSPFGASYSPKGARSRTPLSGQPDGKKKQMPHQRKKGKSGDGEETGFIAGRLVDRLCSDEEPEMSAAELSGAIATQAKQLEELRKEISQKLADLKGGHNMGEEPEISAAELSSAIATQAKQLQELRKELSQRLADLKDGGEHPVQVSPATDYYAPPYTSLPQATAPSHCANSRLTAMLRRLEELEAEEDTIRQRWNTIAYEDPLASRPAVICQRGGSQGNGAQEGVTQEDRAQEGRAEQGQDNQAQKGDAQGGGGQRGRSQGLGGAVQKEGITSNKGDGSKKRTANWTSLPVLPSESLSNIQQYRQHFEQHLSTPGQSKLGGTVPWKVAERCVGSIRAVYDSVALQGYLETHGLELMDK